MKNKNLPKISILLTALILVSVFQVNGAKNQNFISLSCKSDNDLYLVLKENKINCVRYNTPEEAINNASDGNGVLILADGYPENTTILNALLYEKAANKKLRLYVEFPSYLPGIELGNPRGTQWERAVIASDMFTPALKEMRIS